jgi:hypothetical protein
LNDPEVQGKVLDLSGVHDYAYVLLGEVNHRIHSILFVSHCDKLEINR